SFGSLGPLAALMAAADATTTLRLGSMVFANDFRNPVLLAQEAATIDLFSDGRFEFGIGSGWLRDDYIAVGTPFDPPAIRIQRLAEAVPLIKQLFGDTPVTFAGKYYQVENLNLMPKPKQRPHPPILIGGGGRRVLTLAGQEADIVSIDFKGTAAGTKDIATSTDDAVAEQVAWVRAAAGARFDDLELHSLILMMRVADNRHQAAEQMAAELATFPVTWVSNAVLSPEQILASPHFLVGTVDQMVADLQMRRERYGISYITVFGDSVDTFSPIVARLAGS
ncbi:MAG: TIGR03621 family F420-dependent LLM class oxidoreductase, partial [Chloroflexota bacterium]|nr:TIGR03621 family F420-dependent LLM class oxidoreductase [Chloroflexota bacterium]